MKAQLKTVGVLALYALTFFLGAMGGHVAGAALGGRLLSTLAGLGISTFGFHLVKEDFDKSGNKKWFGVFTLGFAGGLITSPVMEVKPSTVQGLSGLGAFTADAKEGSKNAIKNLALKLYLDKTPLKKFVPGLEGLGNLTDDEAQQIIDEMLNSKPKNLNGSITDDYNLKGTITEDFGLGDISLYEEMGDLGAIFHRGGGKFQKLNMPAEKEMELVSAYGNKASRFTSVDEQMMGLGKSPEEVLFQ